MIKDLKKLSPFGRWRHGVVVNDVIQQLKQSVVRDVVPLLLILSTRHTFTEGHRCARHTATSLLTSHIDIDDMLTICFDISDKNKTTNLLTVLPPGQPGFHQVNPGSSRSTLVSRHQISRKFTSSTLSTFIITTRLFTSYQFPPFLWSSASDACKCNQFKSLSTTFNCLLWSLSSSLCWHATLRLCSAISWRHPPQRAVLRYGHCTSLKMTRWSNGLFASIDL